MNTILKGKLNRGFTNAFRNLGKIIDTHARCNVGKQLAYVQKIVLDYCLSRGSEKFIENVLMNSTS